MASAAMASAIPAGSANCILTVYSPTRDLRSRLLEVFGSDSMELSLTELRLKSLTSMLRHLRSLDINQVVIPIEHEQGLALLPVLKLLAGVIPSKSVAVIDPDFKSVPVGRLELAHSLVNLAFASLSGHWKMRRAGRDVEKLSAAPRIAVEPVSNISIAFLNPNLWFGLKAGGSVGHISGVANGLVAAGIPTHLVSAGGRFLTNEQVDYSPIGVPRFFGVPWENNSYRVNYMLASQTEGLIKREKIGLIYQRLTLGNFSGVMLSRKLGNPLIIEYNGSEAWIAKNWGRPLRQQNLAEKIEKVNLHHAHMIVVVSDVLRDELVESGFPPERIISYPNCIEPGTFDPNRFTAGEISALRRKYGIEDDCVVVTFVGTFGQWHGATILASAIRQLLDHQKDWVSKNKVRFLLVGDGVKMAEVRQELGPHVEGPHVVLAGLVPQADAPLYLAASDILCSPHVPNSDGSRFFGSPTKLFEYMAMGKAIIASELDQIGEVLRGSVRIDVLPSGDSVPPHQAPALFAEPGSARHIVEGIRFLTEHPDWRQTLGANARRLALAKYTWRDHVAAIIDRAEQLGLIVRPGEQPRRKSGF
jgi:glycosyltransferase involved in cell wall biosynthesis